MISKIIKTIRRNKLRNYDQGNFQLIENEYNEKKIESIKSGEYKLILKEKIK